MEATGFFRTPLDRQLDESMRLKFSGADITMNSGSEWRGVSIPRASFGHTLPTNREAGTARREEEDVRTGRRKRREDSRRTS